MISRRAKIGFDLFNDLSGVGNYKVEEDSDIQ